MPAHSSRKRPENGFAGRDMAKLHCINDAFLEMENGYITAYGNMNDWTGIDDWNNTIIVDADGGMVFPSYCDSHTHLVCS